MNLKHIIFNTSAQILGRVVSGFFSFLSLLMIAKALGSEYFGEYTKAVTIISFLYIICDFGLNTIFLRDYHKNWQEKFNYFWGARLLMSILLILMATVAIFTTSQFLPGFPFLVVLATTISGISLIGQSTSLSIQAIFQQTKRLDKTALAQIAGAILNTILLAVFFTQIKTNPQSGVLLTSAILSISAIMTAIVSANLLKSLGKFSPSINLNFMKKIWTRSIPIGLTLIFNIIYFRIDTFILSTARPAAEVGIYGLAYKFFEVTLILPTFIMNSLYPDLLKMKNDRQKFWQKSRQILISLGIISLILLMVGWVSAPLLKLVQRDFAMSVPLLRILLTGLPLFYLTSPLMWVLIIWKKQWQLSAIYALSLVFNFAANLIFIPIYGASAAAYVTIATEGVVLLSETIIIIKLLWKKTN
ncbi:MAG: Polysaccharide biosynthesis protein, membrane-associated [Candidatus Curtissbacteria bacterium GW2011_GWA1_40_16]|uniref:Polysaccharide biosynthesis protein, membrane-associated n=1 Tax=Candidatus Curtissbacteria bacterium GW2011_GWA1_40_16 TaxID=1618405 RepID=A0A0G0RHU7_9BACT|nr:MAG: Polysaccharide biosynthesis protein, membrane-associated [Candidatus Curtissbacteria bacterium GW2011_GWA1_40_16]